jgi:hypothetical protein
MRNWKEDAAEKRDKYDFDYGRGVGMVIRVMYFFLHLIPAINC